MVLANERTCLPILAELPGVIIKQVRFAAEVVPIVRVYALSLVVRLDERTPFSLEVVHEKV